MPNHELRSLRTRVTIGWVVNNIRKTPSEMRMRDQLGTLLLQEWKKSATRWVGNPNIP
jgi:hypothetical protein